MNFLKLASTGQKSINTFLLLFLFAALTFTASNFVHANFITLATEEIHDLEQVGLGVSLDTNTNDATSVLTNYTLDGATFLSFWLFNSNGQSSGSIQTPDEWSADWTTYTSFQQHIINRDESPWSFTASIYDGTTIFDSQTLLLEGTVGGQINPGITDGTLFIDLSAVDKATIEWVRFSVSGILPVNNYDRVSEYELLIQFEDINPIPLPPGALLFSSAIALLFIRKKYPVEQSIAQEKIVVESSS
jgi:hypothetical protein